MDELALEQNLKVAIRELAEVERLIGVLCDEYKRTVNIGWLVLYCQDRHLGGPIQGPFWARLRRVSFNSGSKVIKDYLGTRLTRTTMYRLGILRWVKELEDFDRKAKSLRNRRNQLSKDLETVRKVLRKYRYGGSLTGRIPND